jgi:hypothetical protein
MEASQLTKFYNRLSWGTVQARCQPSVGPEARTSLNPETNGTGKRKITGYYVSLLYQHRRTPNAYSTIEPAEELPRVSRCDGDDGRGGPAAGLGRNPSNSRVHNKCDRDSADRPYHRWRARSHEISSGSFILDVGHPHRVFMQSFKCPPI